MCVCVDIHVCFVYIHLYVFINFYFHIFLQGEITNETIRQIAILVDCLIIVCRHFDNILAVIKYEYKPNLIAILTHVFHQVSSVYGGTILFLFFSTNNDVVFYEGLIIKKVLNFPIEMIREVWLVDKS